MKSVYGIIRVRQRVTNSTTCRLVSFQRDRNTMAKRTRISDVQRGISERFFEGRMVGTGTMYKETVLKASTDTGLTKAQVETWIGNQKRTRPQESSSSADVTLKRIKGVKGPNSYNSFCAEFFKTGTCIRRKIY
ncbi:unnamed protein product, partial [Pocillopora meandrina]